MLIELYIFCITLNTIQNYADFASSDYVKQCVSQFSTAGLELSEEYLDFEKYVLSGASIKDVFYTKIYPEALPLDRHRRSAALLLAIMHRKQLCFSLQKFDH